MKKYIIASVICVMKISSSFSLRKIIYAWEYGTCNRLPARRHKRKGNVQFVLWKAGEQGHKEDYWHDFHPSWWQNFQLNKQQ